VLERTLRAFLASCGSASATARDLGVHVTTVRHRLDRVATVSGLRLDSPDVRIACEVLLRASDTHSDQQSSAAALTPSDSAGRVIAPLR
jgi:DNA-binding PucR family transcriptional regulator